MDPESIKQFVQRAAGELGGIEILINSAARVGGAPGGLDVVKDEDILHDYEEKVVGYIRVARQAAPHMKQAGWGRIINISGGAGRNPGTGISGGARNIATVAVTKSLANQLGPFGINVNAIYPGTTLTEDRMDDLRERAQRDNTTLEAWIEREAERSPTKHMVTAEDIAYVVAFLCSPLSISITGEAIAVNGGTSQDVHY